MPLARLRERSSFAGAAAAGLAVAGPSQKTVGAEPAARHPNPIAVSSYSFWRYNDATKLPIERCLDIASEMGFDGFEVLHVQMQDESNSYCLKLKRRAFVHGMPLCGFSTHQGFVFPDATERKKNIDHTRRCLQLAHEMGIPTMRVNTGRWRTTKSFDELIEEQGNRAAAARLYRR